MKFKALTPYQRDVMLWYRNMAAVTRELRRLAEEDGHILCAAYVGPGPPKKPGKHKLGVLWRHRDHRKYQFVNVGETYVFPTPILTTCPTVCLIGANTPAFRLNTPTSNYHAVEVARRERDGQPLSPRMTVLCAVDEARTAAVALYGWLTSHVPWTRAVQPDFPMPGEFYDGASSPEFRTDRAAHLIRGWRKQAATIDFQAALFRTL